MSFRPKKNLAFTKKYYGWLRLSMHITVNVFVQKKTDLKCIDSAHLRVFNLSQSTLKKDLTTYYYGLLVRGSFIMEVFIVKIFG